MTIGTGVAILMFYDLRAHKYLESSINSSRTVNLKSSRGYVVIILFEALSSFLGRNKLLKFFYLFHFLQFPDEQFMDGIQVKYTPAIYTHCYDFTGTRLFAAGGPLPANLYGNYAGIWQ